MEEPKIDQQRLKEFIEVCEEQIFPMIIGEDGKGLKRFKKIVEEKRKAVEKRKQARESYLKNEGGDK